MAAILATKGLKAVVLETYGSGNAPPVFFILREMTVLFADILCVNTRTMLYLQEIYGKIQRKMRIYRSCVVKRNDEQ